MRIVELTPDNWVDYNLESTIDRYSLAVEVLAASMAAREFESTDRHITPAYIHWLETRAFRGLEKANRNLKKQHIEPRDEAEFIADALLVHLAHRQEIQSSLG